LLKDRFVFAQGQVAKAIPGDVVVVDMVFEADVMEEVMAVEVHDRHVLTVA
jgi:hypothetical protein